MARTLVTKIATPQRTFGQELAFIASEQARISASAKSAPATRSAYYDPEYEAWKREMGLDTSLHREAYSVMFNPCGVL